MTYRAIRATRIAYIVLAVSVLFFAFSFSFAISKEEAISALDQNISALALASQIMPGNMVNILSVTLNIFAILTAFFSIYLGFKEAVIGLAVNIISRIAGASHINRATLSLFVAVGIVIFLWIWVSFGCLDRTGRCGRNGDVTLWPPGRGAGADDHAEGGRSSADAGHGLPAYP